MRLLATLAMLGLFALPAAAQMDDSANRIFPYDYEVRDLDNGLRVVVIPTDFPNIVSLQIPVSTGSRNEVEEGKSGFAHFFEHMMFRGTENYTADEYGEILKNAGADQNAYTTDDRTVYHITFSKEDLEAVLMLEADRFQYLQYSEADFRTEALAVLGEYNKNSANPTSKLFEVQRAAAFSEHTYQHTTMGFIEDIEEMPSQFAYSREFFRRYYRPENATVIVAGDVEAGNVFELVERYWSSWEPGAYEVAIPEEPAPSGPLYAHVNWETDTLPWMTVGFRGPGAYPTDRQRGRGRHAGARRARGVCLLFVVRPLPATRGRRTKGRSVLQLFPRSAGPVLAHHNGTGERHRRSGLRPRRHSGDLRHDARHASG